jgi:hypothetical protein
MFDSGHSSSSEGWCLLLSFQESEDVIFFLKKSEDEDVI